ncbi:hypothetical protein CYY_007163 [Polysphondylium violaceum]|uniref:Uncharacterized protein n=1 Tax=Polysphondylium violaceum TaxID=133409 RepID=A0A8J4V545_9MYCE|nr:hypothetical protein CYY_007163 [Polysphondylium violaceum]
MENENKILIVRVIKSMEYRTIKNLLLKDIDLNTNVAEFKQIVREKIQTTSGFLPYRNKEYDSMKIYFIPHGQKSSNLTINLDQDEGLVLDDKKTLAECGIVYETEISFYRNEEYIKFKANPEVKW